MDRLHLASLTVLLSACHLSAPRINPLASIPPPATAGDVTPLVAIAAADQQRRTPDAKVSFAYAHEGEWSVVRNPLSGVVTGRRVGVVIASAWPTVARCETTTWDLLQENTGPDRWSPPKLVNPRPPHAAVSRLHDCGELEALRARLRGDPRAWVAP
jgi:hypothetical protein